MIYTTGPSSINSSAFDERGLSSRGPIELDTISINAEGPVDIGYQLAMNMLGAAVLAQVADATVKTSGECVEVLHKIIPATFDVPLLGAYFPNAGNEDDIAKLGTFGMRKDQGSDIFKGNPSAQSFSAILKMGATPGRYNPGCVSIDGYYAYLSMIRSLGVFTCFSHAFLKNNGVNWLTDTSQTQVGQDAMGLDLQCVGGSKAIGVLTDGIGESTVMNVAPGCKIVFTPFSSEREHGVMPVVTTVGEPSLLSSDDGIVFPYFQTMVLPDKVSAWHVFESLFSKMISSDLDKRRVLLKKIRQGYRQLALFPVGQALSHAFLGVRLAKEANAAMTLIIENSSYQGFVLQRNGMRIVFDGKIEEADDLEDMTIEIKKLALHGKKLIEMVAVINSISQVVGNGRSAKVIPKFKIDIDDISSSRKLVTFLQRLSNEDWTQKSDQIVAIADDLQFGDKYAKESYDSLVIFLEFMKTGDHELLRDYPAYVGGGFIADRSRVAVGLGIFGNTAPSLAYGPKSGLVFNLPKDVTAPDPNVIVQADGKRLLPYLPFRSSAIKKAVSEWNSSFSNGVLRFDQPRKSRKEFCNNTAVTLKISGDPAFSRVYQMVKEVASATRRGNSAGGKKRVAGDDEIREGRAAKKAKEFSSSAFVDLM